MKATFNKNLFFITFLLRIYIVSILLFALLRLVLITYTAGSDIKLFDTETLTSLIVGIQFDNVVLAIILLLPLLLLYIQSLIPLTQKYTTYIVKAYLSIVFPIVFFIAIADIPYFKFFNNRISEAALQWIDSPRIILKMIWENPINLFFLTIALFGMFGIGQMIAKYCKKRLLSNKKNDNYSHNKTIASIGFIMAVGLCLLGIRGKMSHPIRQGDACYSNNPYLNQIGLNPCFTLFKSYITRVNLMDAHVAIKNTKDILHISNNIDSISPIAHNVINGEPKHKYNVVLVIMESMSANYMGIFGNQNKLTPNLDSLSKVSYFFNNAYSAGIHTNNGIFSTLYAFPALKRVRPMSTIPFNTYSGLPFTMHKNGYKNFFFTSHNKQFDNLGSFLPKNYIDKLFSEEDYPKDKIIGPYGVPDDYLFHFATQQLNEVEREQPFFATILTTSNHDPYIIPDYFSTNQNDKSLNAVSYADWSIGRFIEEARKSSWFDNTLFVFVADHGRKVGDSNYDLILSYNHIPIMFYAPKILAAPKVFNNLIGQIDIFPTLMGLLHMDYVNNTLGTDVLKEKRDCIYFSADDKLGCVNDEWLYIYRYGGTEGLYKYRENNIQDFSKQAPQIFEQLKQQALSQTQMSEWMISSNKTTIK